ncbi:MULTISPECIES: hypothetical protein [unclassified Mesorhizobium]|uniref:hypothetical protein n=1 Tax=unclassified Mesorhizobium TaxID=325217 RepID=UPI00333B3E74
MARSSTSVDVAVIGAGPYLSLAAHLRARDVEHRIFGELMGSWLMGSWKHFLGPTLLRQIRLVEGAPQLSAHYETSVPGLHFIGPAAANSFGPVCRFVYGTYHPAHHLARHLAAVLARFQPASWVPSYDLKALS